MKSNFTKIATFIPVVGTKPQIISGTEKLLADLQPWFIALVASVTVVVVLINAFKWYAAGEQEKPMHIKTIKLSVAIGRYLVGIGAFVPCLFSYYTAG